MSDVEAAVDKLDAELAAYEAEDGVTPSANGHVEDGAQLLDDVHAATTRYVIFPSQEAADANTLFLAATHAQPAWEHASRLLVKSPLRRCGKTRLQEVDAELCHRPLKTSNISVAALVRSIEEEDPPTLSLDEADSIFAKRRGERSEGAEDLRGILNAGHSRGWPYIRWDASARKSEECPTFAMAIVGGIGDFPDTIEDRSVIIAMRRRAPSEYVEQFRRRRSVPPLHKLRDRLHAWVRAHIDVLTEAEPELPAEDRAADVWEPLIAIADLAGGSWPERARRACKVLTGESETDEATAAERLLSDLRDIFGDEDKLSTATILERLQEIEEAPWADWYGKALAPRGLARLLRPYGIKSRTVRVGEETPKGYDRADLEDAWRRYLGTPAQQAQQAQQGNETPGQPRGGYVADSTLDIRNRDDLHVQDDVADVADVSDERLDEGTSSFANDGSFGSLATCTRCPEQRHTYFRDDSGNPICPKCKQEMASVAS